RDRTVTGVQTCALPIYGARAALDTLRSRGPDDSALLDLGDAVLGHTRLAVIDLVSGQQPMRSADGRYTIVFNGEIYNFRDLRKRSEERRVGKVWYSRCR